MEKTIIGSERSGGDQHMKEPKSNGLSQMRLAEPDQDPWIEWVDCK